MNTLELGVRDWQALGQPPPPALQEARNQLHWAAQIAASVGYTLVAPEPDWSHTSLAWIDPLGALAGQAVPSSPAFRAALRLADLTLLLLDARGNTVSTFALDGRTLNEGYAWLASAIALLTGAEAPSPSLVRPDHELPAHPVGEGAPFSLNPPKAFTETARWYANADRVLQPLSASPHASPVQCWPHHFDLAVLFSFESQETGEAARSIGVGLVPGDESYAEPYWYITPYPLPDTPALPPLDGGGVWRTEGWRGAVLTGSTLVAAGGAVEQATRVQAFVRAGLAASRALLGFSD